MRSRISFALFFAFVLSLFVVPACGSSDGAGVIDLSSLLPEAGSDPWGGTGNGKADGGGADATTSQPPALACAGKWSTETVDAAPRAWDVGGGVLVVDKKGGAHLAYGSAGAIRYAHKSYGITGGGTWTTSALPEGGWNVALAVDDKGGLHVSYTKQESGKPTQVRYAYRAPGATTWELVTVDQVADQLADTTAIGVDAQGGVHIRYIGPGGSGALAGDLRYAYKAAGGTFVTSMIAPSAAVPGSVAVGGRSLAVDANGGVHVAFFPSWMNLAYAYRPKGGTWTVTSVDEQATYYVPPSVAVDAKGNVHLGYLGPSARSVKRAYKPAGGSWSTSVVDTNTAQIFEAGLAADDAGGVHVTFRVGDSLRYYRASATSTSYDFFNYVDTGAEEPRIAVDDKGGVHLAYRREAGQEVRYAYRCSGGCPKQTCAQMGADCGSKHDGCNVVTCGSCSDPSLCGAGGTANKCCAPKTCASMGKQCGAVSDGCGKMLDCGGCNAPLECGSVSANTCGACVSGHWSKDTVYALGQVGRASSIAIDAANGAHVVFADDTNDDLVYGYHAPGGGWTTAVIDPSASKIWGTATKVDASGRVHVLYTVGNGSVLELRYATKLGAGAWTKSVVYARTTSLAANVAAALDASSTLHAAFYDGSSGSIMHATLNAATGWTFEAIAAGGNEAFAPGTYGELVSIAADAATGVHVAFSRTNAGADAIEHAYRSVMGAWTVEDVVTSSTLHKGSSIAVDATGTVVVAYAEWSALYVASKAAGGTFASSWVGNGDRIEPLVSTPAPGKVEVVFYDDAPTSRRLRVATSTAGAPFVTTLADTPSNAGRSPAMARDAAGALHVVSMDNLASDLLYVYRCP